MLRPMTQAEFDVWIPEAIENYAQSKIRANGLTLEEARESSNADFKRILPQGQQTPNHSFFLLVEGDTQIGSGWYWLRSIGGETQAFIYDVVIDERMRGQGHGRRLMQELEKAAGEAGATRIALHVFGDNTTAIKLYQSLGFATTNLNMEKRIIK